MQRRPARPNSSPRSSKRIRSRRRTWLLSVAAQAGGRTVRAETSKLGCRRHRPASSCLPVPTVRASLIRVRTFWTRCTDIHIRFSRCERERAWQSAGHRFLDVSSVKPRRTPILPSGVPTGDRQEAPAASDGVSLACFANRRRFQVRLQRRANRGTPAPQQLHRDLRESSAPLRTCCAHTLTHTCTQTWLKTGKRQTVTVHDPLPDAFQTFAKGINLSLPSDMLNKTSVS